MFFTRSTLHSLTLPEVLQCHKELLCLRVLSALLWICRHWLLFPCRLAAVLMVTQVRITQGIPLNPHLLVREHIPWTLSMVSQCVWMLCTVVPPLRGTLVNQHFPYKTGFVSHQCILHNKYPLTRDRSLYVACNHITITSNTQLERGAKCNPCLQGHITTFRTYYVFCNICETFVALPRLNCVFCTYHLPLKTADTIVMT